MRRIAVVLALTTASCRPSDPAGRSAVVVLAEGATSVHYSRIEGEENIVYETPLPYPAESLIARIDTTLKANGFTGVDEPDAFRWNHAVTAEDKRVDHWNGTWRSADGLRTAEYNLAYSGRRDILQVQARVGAPRQQGESASTVPIDRESLPESIELAENEAALLCGAEGTAVVAFEAVNASAAGTQWRFRSAQGETREGKQRVEERPGEKPDEIDVRDAHFTAGPWELSWSPGSMTIESDARTLDRARQEGRVTSATSFLYYPRGLRVRKIESAGMPRLDLRTACER